MKKDVFEIYTSIIICLVIVFGISLLNCSLEHLIEENIDISINSTGILFFDNIMMIILITIFVFMSLVIGYILLQLSILFINFLKDYIRALKGNFDRDDTDE